MARYSWRERPLEDEPMVKVVKRTFGDGRVRYVLMYYEGVVFANFREDRQWLEGYAYKSKARAEKIAKRKAEKRRKQSFKNEETP